MGYYGAVINNLIMNASKTKYAFCDNDLILDKPEKQYILKVKDLDEKDRPREKLIKRGPEILTSAELLGIILSVGTKREEVLSMSTRIFKEYGEKNIITEKNPKILSKELDIPLIKACQIISCFELGRRFFKTSPGTVVIRNSRQAYDYFKDMGSLPKEHLRGIYLNSRYKVVYDETISIGSLTSGIVHPREVFRPAIEHLASAVIIAHNHPSGICKPNEDDIEVTQQLMEAGKILGVDLLDHLIIAKNKFVSISNKYLS